MCLTNPCWIVDGLSVSLGLDFSRPLGLRRRSHPFLLTGTSLVSERELLNLLLSVRTFKCSFVLGSCDPEDYFYDMSSSRPKFWHYFDWHVILACKTYAEMKSFEIPICRNQLPLNAVALCYCICGHQLPWLVGFGIDSYPPGNRIKNPAKDLSCSCCHRMVLPYEISETLWRYSEA
ncbi:hypothetical protein NPIL_194071 [Nephila pilipes]|uniref:Uncharacterized protein n=1 Tax=Nephila pilipes TaxID=299642 RepID=A0A8X6T666_NEPPI|nr:hypothetical protein NPIL_194071 [Nephila pilipes]